MQAQRDISLSGKKFTVQQLPARAALRTLRRLGKSVAPAFASLFGASGKASIGDIDVSKLGPALTELFSNLSDDDLDHFVNTFLASALVDGKPLLPALDIIFQGDIGALVRLLVFAAEANYGNFFHAFGGLPSVPQITS